MKKNLRINVFDWKKEFPQVFNNQAVSLSLARRGTKGEVEEENPGGFDVVIGNPPYLKLTKNSIDNSSMEYFENQF